MRAIRAAVLLTLVVLSTGALRAAEVVEKYDDGQTKVRYATDAEGRKVGEYLEYFDNGKVRIKAMYLRGEMAGDYTEHFESGHVKIKTSYKAGKLSGAFTQFHDNGKPAVKAAYADGKRQGTWTETDADGRVTVEQVFWNDTVVCARSVRMIRAALDGLLSPAGGAKPIPPAGDETAATRDPLNLGEVRRLNAYRYLVGLACDVTLSDAYCDLARAGAGLCAKIDKLDHTPANPGLPEDEYKKAYQGTSHSNLHEGRGTRGSVDRYMDDSDPSNIDRVGHRRWCLNPAMKECGFGQSGKFSAMYAHDASRKDAPDYDHVAYPAAGFMPNSFFAAGHAWSVSLNPKKYRKPDRATVSVTVSPLVAAKGQALRVDQRGPQMEMDYFNVDLGGFGIGNAIIFRPKGVSTRDGSAYWVEIKGLKKLDGADATLEYLVHFVTL